MRGNFSARIHKCPFRTACTYGDQKAGVHSWKNYWKKIRKNMYLYLLVVQ